MWFYLEGLTSDIDLCASSLFLQQESYSEFCTELPLHMQKGRYWAITISARKRHIYELSSFCHPDPLLTKE